MFKWFVDNKEWLFGGAGATILIAALKYVISYAEKYIYNHVIRNKQNEMEEKLKARLGEIMVQSPIIEVELKIDKEEVEFFCITYKRNEERVNQYDFTWIENAKFRIINNENGFALDKKQIRDNLKRPSDPYKFYMTVPNCQDKINKYYLRLIKSRYVVTGRGSVDGDKNKWRIWFLLPGEPVHPDTQSPTLINHTLVNQALIRNTLYRLIDTR